MAASSKQPLQFIRRRGAFRKRAFSLSPSLPCRSRRHRPRRRQGPRLINFLVSQIRAPRQGQWEIRVRFLFAEISDTIYT